MTHVKASLLALVVAASLVGSIAVASSPTLAALPAAKVADAVSTTTALAAKPRPVRYRVRPGITFSSPLSKAAKRAIISKSNSVIRHTPRGSEIRIFSWKIYTRAGVSALLDAQRRGVKIRVIMDKRNTIVEYNPHFRRLKAGLLAGNRGRRVGHKSFARLCDHSCRGRGGAAHSKFMLFSQSGNSQNIYMQSSANWGDPAANLQWNDLYTFVGARGIYRAGVEVFDQAWKDTPVFPTWREYATPDGKTIVGWTPQGGTYPNRLLTTLKRTSCRGATGGAGNANGRTIIRVAPDVIRGDAGLAIAKQLSRLWSAGCDVKVGYTVLGRDITAVLRQGGARGPVPLRHLVQDFDGDGVFDRYFHLKAYTINGVIGRNTESYWVQIGSANTSKLAKISDEQIVYFLGQRKITKAYENHVGYWFNNFPSSARTSSFAARGIAGGTVDPYAKIELD